MGGFSNIIGHVAEGYTQAAQVDKQRQFEQEMDSRRQAGDFLQKIAQDESAHPDVRNAAMTEWGNLHSLPFNKQYKLDPHKAGLIRPGLSTPTAPPEQQVGAQGAQVPVFGNPPPAPQMSTPAPPPGDIAGTFATLSEQTSILAHRTGAVTQAQIGAQIGAREQALKSMQGLPQDQQAMAMGIPGVYAAMLRSRLAGARVQMTAEQAMQDPEVAALMQSKGYDSSTPGMYAVTHDKIGNAINVEPITPTGLVPKTSTSSQSMDQSGGIHTTRTTGPAKGGGQPSAGQSNSGGKTAGSPHVTSSSVTNWQDDNSPVGMAAKRWATQGQAPKGGAMAERQVMSYMKQHGMEPALPVPPALQQKIQQSFVARNSAIGLIDDVMKNSHVLDSLLSAGKIQTAIDPSTGAALVTRAAGLSDKEAKVAGDFQQLVEHANLLRGPLGATGFRGHEAWQALQSQRGNLMSDPRITRQVLSGMRDRLVGLNSADKMVLGGHGTDMPEAQTATPVAPPPSNGRSVGDIVSVKGKKIKITAIHPDGTFDGEPQ